MQNTINNSHSQTLNIKLLITKTPQARILFLTCGATLLTILTLKIMTNLSSRQLVNNQSLCVSQQIMIMGNINEYQLSLLLHEDSNFNY